MVIYENNRLFKFLTFHFQDISRLSINLNVVYSFIRSNRLQFHFQLIGILNISFTHALDKLLLSMIIFALCTYGTLYINCIIAIVNFLLSVIIYLFFRNLNITIISLLKLNSLKILTRVSDSSTRIWIEKGINIHKKILNSTRKN